MEQRAVFLLLFTRNFVVSVRRSSSSSGCLEKAALFNCGSPWAFHITIFNAKNGKGQKLEKENDLFNN